LISFDDMDLLSDKLYRYDETGFLAIPFANTQKDVWDYAIKKISKLPAFVEFLQSLKPVEMFEATMSASAIVKSVSTGIGGVAALAITVVSLGKINLKR